VEFPVELLKTFLAVVDTGGFTRAGQVVHRTQSAISMQMRRLEESVGTPLFERRGRSFVLSADGERLLPYARRMLKLHEDAVAAMIQPQMAGPLTIGTPDIYARAYLPGMLAWFANNYPRVQITVRCEPSVQLAQAHRRGETDLTLLSGEQYQSLGEIVRQEQLVWVASRYHLVHEESPLPLAMFQADCIYRKYAFHSLDAAGADYRIAYQSESTAGILAAVSSGLAVTVLAENVVTEEFRILGSREGLPFLPSAPMVMATSGRSPVVDSLADFIRDGMVAVSK
tara:strand:+ start:93501 stop:94352 length:852 start_codon:yes stop_codon:yes gene_type:complete